MANIHKIAINNICRVCFRKKETKDLRTINNERLTWLNHTLSITILEEEFDNWYPTKICIGCAGTLSRHLKNPDKHDPPNFQELAIGKPNRLGRIHFTEECEVCAIYKGNRGISSANRQHNVMEHLEPNMNLLSLDSPDYSPPTERLFGNVETAYKCTKCYSNRMVHRCSRENAIKNTVLYLEKEGIADEVIASLLNIRAERQKQPDVCLPSGPSGLNVRLLNGSNGSLFPLPSVAEEDLIQIQQEIGLSDNSLHRLCQWLKMHGLRTPSSKKVTTELKESVKDIFTDSTILLQQKKNECDNEDEDNNYLIQLR